MKTQSPRDKFNRKSCQKRITALFLKGTKLELTHISISSRNHNVYLPFSDLIDLFVPLPFGDVDEVSHSVLGMNGKLVGKHAETDKFDCCMIAFVSALAATEAKRWRAVLAPQSTEKNLVEVENLDKPVSVQNSLYKSAIPCQISPDCKENKKVPSWCASTRRILGSKRCWG